MCKGLVWYCLYILMSKFMSPCRPRTKACVFYNGDSLCSATHAPHVGIACITKVQSLLYNWGICLLQHGYLIGLRSLLGQGNSPTTEFPSISYLQNNQALSFMVTRCHRDCTIFWFHFKQGAPPTESRTWHGPGCSSCVRLVWQIGPFSPVRCCGLWQFSDVWGHQQQYYPLSTTTPQVSGK